MFLFGKSKKYENSLRSGVVEKEISRMIAVPRNAEDIADPNIVAGRLKSTDEITVKSIEPDILVEYKGTEYVIAFDQIDLNVPFNEPELVSLNESEKQLVTSARSALFVDMVFSENNMDSFHLQIKLLNMLVPNMGVLMDCNAYRMHSGRWAVMTAESDVAPSPNCMFIAHIVNDTEKSDSVWLHTHGLNRCGTIELEILGANMGNWRNLGNALNEIAYRLIGDNKFIDEKEPITVGVFADNKDIVVTWQRSEWALRDFPKGILGGVDDRNDEHSINMGVVYVYASEKDAMNGKLTSILKYAEKLTENTVYYKTTAETQRMRALALERVEYMKKISASLKDCTVLIKIGLTPDPEYGFDDDQYEYIWFEADEMGEDTFKATLTQDAYYVEGMTEGVQREFLYSEIVDWRVFNDEETFTPDDVYLFDF